MRWQTKAISALAAFLMLWEPVFAAAPSISTSTAAKLTEARGNIFKRGFVDWTKDAWANPEPAAVGDTLEEGMQLGTGDKSWAQVTWPNVTTRAWANTVFAVAPNQRLVYLIGGEMLFNLDKNRKNKKDYVVWTKVLQARIRGTTVLVQATKELSRITVLEGCVDVMNRLDRSVIRVTPGIVYEIRTPGLGHGHPMQQIHRVPQEGMRRHPKTSGDEPVARTTATSNEPERTSLENPDPTVNTTGDTNTSDRTTSTQENLKISSSQAIVHEPIADANSTSGDVVLLSNLCSQIRPPLSVFETSRSTTSLYVANADNLQNHSLVNKFESPLASLPLVESCLSKLPPVCHESISPAVNPSALANNQLARYSSDTGTTTNLTSQHQDVAAQVIQDTMPNPGISFGQTDSVLIQNAEIIRVPTAMDYKVGPLIGTQVALPPGAIHNFPPVGLIGTGSLQSQLPIQAHQEVQAFDHPSGMPANIHNLANEQVHKLPSNIRDELVGTNMMSRGDLNSVRNLAPAHNAVHHLPPHLSNSAMMGPNIMPRPDMHAVRNLLPMNSPQINSNFDRPPLMIAPNPIDSSNNFINPNLPPP
ncbi:MAG: FecR domain-containing protein [Candidatus Melainabacteria bacterium]|nr:FecR domain-containing protein [Candidatus Melainabacteria bacterium]